MKKALAIILVLAAMAMAIVPAYAGIVGKDGYLITGAWDAEQLWEKGLFLGSNGTFRLDEPLIRTEAAVMLVRLLGAENDAKAQNNAHPFTDVPEWANDYVGYLYKNGLTSGVSETAYGSDDNISADQYFTLLLRSLDYKDNVDFVWDSAAKSALDLEIIGEPCYEDYVSAPVFMRDLAVRASYSALMSPKKGSETPLADVIMLPGKPKGDMPVATLFVEEPEEHEEAGDTMDAGNAGDAGDAGATKTSGAAAEAYISEIGSFNLLDSSTIDIKVTCTASGFVTVTASCGSSSASASADMQAGKVYTVSFDVDADVIGTLSGGGSITLSGRTITFSTSSGSSQSASVFGAAPTFKGAKITSAG